MSLGTAPAVSRRLLPLVMLLTVIPWLGILLAVLGGLRTELGERSEHLAAILVPLCLGLPLACFLAAETLAYLLGSRLLRPAGLLVQVALNAAALDLRHVPPPGGDDEPGRLSVALGRLIRHLAQRRRDLDAMAGEIAGHGLVADGAARALRLLAERAPVARLATAEPDPAAGWLNPALHRLLCALASFVVVLGAARLSPDGMVAVVAMALLFGRVADRLRRLGQWTLWLVLVTALVLWLLPTDVGPDLLPRCLAVAAAASFALQCGSGWRGPAQGCVQVPMQDDDRRGSPATVPADAAWLHAGFAGALAGGGMAAALVGIAGPLLAADLLPLPLVLLGVTAALRGPGAATLLPAGWPGATATRRVLHQAAVRHLVFAEALPAGLMLGLALALAAAHAELALGVVVLASLVAGAQGAAPRLRLRRWAAWLLASAALGLLVLGLPLFAAPAAAVAAVLAWPFGPGAPPRATSPGGFGLAAAPRQAALLAMLARALGVVLGLFAAGAWQAGLRSGTGWSP